MSELSADGEQGPFMLIMSVTKSLMRDIFGVAERGLMMMLQKGNIGKVRG